MYGKTAPLHSSVVGASGRGNPNSKLMNRIFVQISNYAGHRSVMIHLINQLSIAPHPFSPQPRLEYGRAPQGSLELRAQSSELLIPGGFVSSSNLHNFGGPRASIGLHAVFCVAVIRLAFLLYFICITVYLRSTWILSLIRQQQSRSKRNPEIETLSSGQRQHVLRVFNNTTCGLARLSITWHVQVAPALPGSEPASACAL
jgi:hypothetical protein